jgi:2-hydroxychromene-2-carboxylate isomerase
MFHMPESQERHDPVSSTIEFWFEFGSTYSYPAVMRIDALAARHGVRVEWRPFLLGPIFKSLGWESSPFVLQKEKGDYVWKDMERQCRKFGIPWKRPSIFPRTAILPARIALLGAEQPWIALFAQRIMQLNFVADQDIQSVDAVSGVLSQIGLPAPDLIAQAQSEAIKSQLREQTGEASRRGVFGAPTFFVRGEMFWGNDRLDDALELAAE